MASEIRITDQKFYAKLNNGDTFTLNPSDFSRHLKGGVLEEVKAVFNVQVEWYSLLMSYDMLYDNSANTLRIVKTGLNFVKDGFSVGDSVKFSISSPQAYITGDVTSLRTGEITLDNVVVVTGTLSNNWSTGVSDQNNDILTGLTNLTALKYKFGLIDNDESINFLSKLTNTEQIYLIEDIDHGVPLAFSDGITQGNNKAWVTGSAKCAFVGLVPDSDYITPQDTTQEFQIEHIFKINPFYRDGELDSLEGTDTPPVDIFDGDRSLKYVLETEFRTVLNNPNTSKITKYDTQEGSVGYFDESYNGYPSDYTIEDLVYFNVTDSLTTDKIDIDVTNRITFTIKSDAGNIDAGMAVIVGHSAIIDSLTYSNNTDDYKSIWLDETLRTTEGAVSTSDDIIQDYTATRIDANTLDVQYDIIFSGGKEREVNDGQDYLLYYTIADPTKTVDEGSKVTGRIDVNVYDKSADIAGLFDVTINEQYPIPYEFDKGVSTGFTSGKLFIEDEQMLYARFKVLDTYLGEDLDLLEDVNLESLKFKIVAYNTVTNTWFDLRTLNIDLSDQVVSGNIQNIELDSTRGYILTDTDIFNSLTLTTDTNDGTFQFYDLQVGYKIPWQSWLELISADADFYDKTKSHNGLNQNSSNYSFTNNYVIKILVDAEVETTGITTNYVNRSGDFLAYNYDTDDQIPDAYSCVINTFKEDGTPILNNIIEKGFTELRAVITPLVPPIFSQSVDFTEVSNNWTRYAHGNYYTPASTFGQRLGVWANDQANDTDTFNDNVSNFTKLDAGLYTSTASSIETNQNCFAVYGCYSLLQYEFYSITGKMFSNAADNDTIIYDICFFVDEFGVENSLSLCVTTGGIPSSLGNLWVDGDPLTSTIWFEDVSANWSLVYNFGKRDCINLEQFDTTSAIGLLWNNPSVGDFSFDVSRTGADITIDGAWTIGGTPFTNQITYNLNDNAITEKFKGFSYIGFGFMSQDQGGFKDVELSLPSSDFYGVLRVEPEESSSDFSMNELNTEIENTDNSLLEQITGTENKASLSWDGTSFIIQGLIDTDKTVDGEEYKFSAELRSKDLIL